MVDGNKHRANDGNDGKPHGNTKQTVNERIAGGDGAINADNLYDMNLTLILDGAKEEATKQNDMQQTINEDNGRSDAKDDGVPAQHDSAQQNPIVDTQKRYA